MNSSSSSGGGGSGRSVRDEEVHDVRFSHPSTFFVAGSSGSGKSVFLKKLITNFDFLFENRIGRVVWCFSAAQPFFNDKELEHVEFVHGFDPEVYKRNSEPTFLILDDLMTELAKSDELSVFFTKNRHMNLSVAFVTQNLFAKGIPYRTMSLNANYIVVMRMIRDKQQIATLVSQMFPDQKRFAKDAILQATKTPYSYCLLDCKAATAEVLRIRTKIFPADWEDCYTQYVFIPK